MFYLQIFKLRNMSFNASRGNKILSKISRFTVANSEDTGQTASSEAV